MKKSPVLAGCIPCAKCRGAGEKRRTEFDVFGPFMQGIRNFQGPAWIPKVCWHCLSTTLCSCAFSIWHVLIHWAYLVMCSASWSGICSS